MVNKKKKLKKTYIPNLYQLRDCFSDGKQYLTKEAKKAFEKMCDDALEDNLYLIAVSTYRSYNYQKRLYKQYVKTKGRKYARLCSAKAGHSEHQTGLAVDIANKTLDYDNFDRTNEFKWVKDNAYKYGFILRYKKADEKITGIKYESWHFRYVGEEIAKYMKENEMTYEEYYVRFIENK